LAPEQPLKNLARKLLVPQYAKTSGEQQGKPVPNVPKMLLSLYRTAVNGNDMDAEKTNAQNLRTYRRLMRIGVS
jgi:hypothetical protein